MHGLSIAFATAINSIAIYLFIYLVRDLNSNNLIIRELISCINGITFVGNRLGAGYSRRVVSI